jgi:hypothetical protein
VSRLESASDLIRTRIEARILKAAEAEFPPIYVPGDEEEESIAIHHSLEEELP